MADKTHPQVTTQKNLLSSGKITHSAINPDESTHTPCKLVHTQLQDIDIIGARGMNKAYYNQGWTLMKLMITVAIVGVLAAVAVPSYFGYIETS
jgi:hypothetical protein